MTPIVMGSIVRAERVAYRYPQNNHGLSPTDLAVQAGERVLVSGASGSGKSTLARCLTGLIPHLYRGEMEGAVWLGKQRTTEAPLWQLAEQAGLVSQNPAAQMLAESVEREILFGLENLGLEPAEMARRLEETLARFHLDDKRHRSPQMLSGGEQQKLALAAIMARKPPLLVLDEPLSMLDGTAAGELVAHLGDVTAQGTAVVVCEHRHEYFASLAGLRTIPLGTGHAALPETGTLPPLPPVPPFRLEVANVSVRLGGRPVLDRLGFEASGGQVLAIVGRNGVGKTTLLRSLAGLQKHEGEIVVDGERPGLGPELGMVFQNADLQIFNASVREEILFRLPRPDQPLYEWLLATLGLERYADVPPLLLSEGEKRRVALATVLMRLPRHGVLLDEPSLGQDTAHKEQLIRVAHALAGTGRLVILTTHDLSLAARADRLLLMSESGFVAEGPPARVLHDDCAWAQIGLSVPDWIASKVDTEQPAMACRSAGGIEAEVRAA